MSRKPTVCYGHRGKSQPQEMPNERTHHFTQHSVSGSSNRIVSEI